MSAKGTETVTIKRHGTFVPYRPKRELHWIFHCANIGRQLFFCGKGLKLQDMGQGVSFGIFRRLLCLRGRDFGPSNRNWTRSLTGTE